MEKTYTVHVKGKPFALPLYRSVLTQNGTEFRIDVLASEGNFNAITMTVYPDESYDDVLRLRSAAY